MLMPRPATLHDFSDITAGRSTSLRTPKTVSFPALSAPRRAILHDRSKLEKMGEGGSTSPTPGPFRLLAGLSLRAVSAPSRAGGPRGHAGAGDWVRIEDDPAADAPPAPVSAAAIATGTRRACSASVQDGRWPKLGLAVDKAALDSAPLRVAPSPSTVDASTGLISDRCIGAPADKPIIATRADTPQILRGAAEAAPAPPLCRGSTTPDERPAAPPKGPAATIDVSGAPPTRIEVPTPNLRMSAATAMDDEITFLDAAPLERAVSGAMATVVATRSMPESETCLDGTPGGTRAAPAKPGHRAPVLPLA